MKITNQLIILSILAQSASAGTVCIWNEGKLIGLRTNGTVGFAIDGEPASTLDANGDGVIDDGQTGFYSSINVDAEGSASLDLSGDDFDWALRFQMYDADGVFGFTENFDDSARVSVTPILSNLNLGARGDASTLISDADSGSSWNTRTFGNYDFSEGGWFDVTVELDEKGGGAQSAVGIGFGFFNGNSTIDTDFQGIGYASANGQATFDTDANGASFGVLTSNVPEPTTPILGLIGVLGLALRRRK
ncbi:PEP-CTERM sorting domain-containing protein [Akkermansiaceae bacterium]|nr:PEP-CTERM sorting domain-containing protein [Akkermansiaceae bacterium]